MMSWIRNKYKILSYKIYRWKLDRTNKKLISEGKLPIADNRGYPFIPSEHDGSLPEIPEPIGKLFYIETEYDKGRKSN